MNLLTSTNVHRLSRDVRGGVGREEETGETHVLGTLGTSEWDAAHETLPTVLAVEVVEDTLRVVVPEGRAHDAWAYGVHGHVVRRHLEGERLGQPDHAELRGAVVCQSGQSLFAGHGGDVDDPPGLLGNHVRKESLRGDHHSLQVHVHHGLPIVVANVKEVAYRRDSCVVHQDVDRSDATLNHFGRLVDGIA